MWMWHLKIWVSAGLGSARGMLGLSNFMGLFQLQYFSDSVV